MAFEFKIPDLGENIQSGTIAKILVAVGDAIENDQPLLELETDKAVIEVPSDVAGEVKEVLAKEGEKVNVGQVVLKVEAVVAKGEKPATSPDKLEEPELKAPEPSAVPAEPNEPSVVEKETAPEAAIVSEKTAVTQIEKAVLPQDVAPAAPSTRRFAREIGININEVPGTGPGGRISVDDVKIYAKRLNEQRSGGGLALPGLEIEELPDFSKWGEIERQPMSKVREVTAKHLSFAWATVPHVTQFDKADITELEKLRKQYGKSVEAAGGKLTVTAILLKVLAAALKKFPQFNASIDMNTNEIIYKKYIHIGVAVETERGLLVPVIRNVDQKNITEISVELGQVAEKARNRKLLPDEMQGGTFSVSNLGGIGGTAFTPIVNSPEVAILGISRSSIEAKFIEGEFQPRLMLPLSLSYDHRLIDGADGARFVRWVVEALESPFRLLI